MEQWNLFAGSLVVRGMESPKRVGLVMYILRKSQPPPSILQAGENCNYA
jgi:hypothetical protein